MQLVGKNAVVYGAAGSMGSAVSRAFAAAGARVFLAGRTAATLDALAEEIRAGGGQAHAAVVDATDKESVDAHAAGVVAQAGSLDASFNAVAYDVLQNVPLVDMSLEDFVAPVVSATTTHFLTATAAARHMVAQGSGAIVMLSSSAARESRHEMGGFSLACASIETLVRSLAGEVGRHGVRVVGLRPNFTPETVGASDDDLPVLVKDTLLGRLPRLSEVAGTAVYLASDAAGATTGVVVDLSCGAIV
ncbi:SDR family NAD(P)-dependent oxidoreductase [Cellulosimicrobium cellulans]|uniref:SDR family NAD(P)-dependent oxidoreductase n=1 Tax=Cellulosimicrobium cellulans TaxID=1710 RepID=UPI003652E71D